MVMPTVWADMTAMNADSASSSSQGTLDSVDSQSKLRSQEVSSGTPPRFRVPTCPTLLLSRPHKANTYLCCSSEGRWLCYAQEHLLNLHSRVCLGDSTLATHTHLQPKTEGHLSHHLNVSDHLKRITPPKLSQLSLVTHYLQRSCPLHLLNSCYNVLPLPTLVHAFHDSWVLCYKDYIIFTRLHASSWNNWCACNPILNAFRRFIL